MEKLTDLPNIGLDTAKQLIAVGIATPEELRVFLKKQRKTYKRTF